MELTADILERGGPDGFLAWMHKLTDMVMAAARTIEAQSRRIEELERLATTDELTGLANRRGFYEAFIRELDKANRYHNYGGLLVMIDIDNFKGINDRYGHAAGDAALRLMAQSLQARIRVMDMAARLGGDEFVLLLAGADRVDTARRAQLLAWQLSQLTMDWNGEEIRIRASLGLKTYGPGDRAEDIFEQADGAMYAAKAGKTDTIRALA